MNAIILLVVGIAILVIGYVTYGAWLAKQWGVDPSRETPAHTLEDGVDYVPSKAPVLFGHHFSSIAGAGPINGPIQAAVFGWVPVLLWILIGGIFFGAVHDFGALVASIRHKGHSIGEVIQQNIGDRAKKLFIIFSYLTLILVVAAFTSIVAGTFVASKADPASVANARTATISIWFIVLAIIFGFCVYRKNAPLGISSVIGVIGIIAVIALGYNYPVFYLSQEAWMVILGLYILVASVTPVWILLQPRDYLSSFLLYAMMIAAIIGIFGSHPTIDMPAFTGFESSIGYLFPALFITIACGAISGFHSLVGSGTTAKQINSEKDARPIGYGGMLVECALAIIALISVGYIWSEYSGGTITNPTQVFATGISRMLAAIGLEQVEGFAYSLVILAVSTFALTSLDTATRLARFMFQEFWLKADETPDSVTGYKKILCNPYVSTLITVVLGVGLGLGGYSKIWALFGAANQLLAALALLAVAAWLGNCGKNNKMLYIPMVFMLLATLTSLVLTFINKVKAIAGGAGDMAAWLQAVFSIILFALALVLVVEGVQALAKKKAKN